MDCLIAVTYNAIGYTYKGIGQFTKTNVSLMSLKSTILFYSLCTHFVVQPFILPQENPCHSEMKEPRISREISGAMECSEVLSKM